MTLKKLLLYLLICAVIGVIAGEFMGAILVKNSNKFLLKEQAWIETNGYIGVPGTRLKRELSDWGTCFKAGLFFALSLGLAYGLLWGLLFILIKAIIANLPQKFFNPDDPKLKIARYFAFVPLFILLLFYFIDTSWKALLPFGFFILITPIVFYIVLFNFFGYKADYYYKKFYIYLLGFIIFFSLTAFLFTSYLSARDFIRVRDQILLKNKWGKNISRFYYQYTLYAAEVIKPFTKKLQVSIKLDESILSCQEVARIKKLLIRHDIFPGADAPSGYILKKEGDAIQILSSHSDVIIETDISSFLNSIELFFTDFEEKIDRARFLRFFIKVSLFYCLPIFLIMVLYLVFLTLVHTLYSFFLEHNALFETGVTVSLLLISLIIIRLAFSHPSSILTVGQEIDIITGKKEGDRIGALLSIAEKGKREGEKALLSPYIPQIVSMIKDNDPIVRKYGIIFIRKVDYKKAVDILIVALKDPDFNVAYNAARALGAYHSRKAIKPLLEILHNSAQWYLQLNAYCALKRLGWRQGTG
ncbi:MAG: HEAT repeat domain-containing protein [bacterium]